MQSPSQIYSLMSLEFNYGTVTKGFLWSQNYGLMYFSMAYSAAFVILSLTKWFPSLGRPISWSTAYRCLHLLAQRHIRINAQIYMFFLVLLCCQKQLPPQSRRGLTLLLNIKQNITLCYEKTFFITKIAWFVHFWTVTQFSQFCFCMQAQQSLRETIMKLTVQGV